MFTVKCHKSRPEITHVYCTEEFTVSSRDSVISFNNINIKVDAADSFYQKVYIENSAGKTIAHFRVTDMIKNHVEGF